jgi:hypothetical protein
LYLLFMVALLELPCHVLTGVGDSIKIYSLDHRHNLLDSVDNSIK